MKLSRITDALNKAAKEKAVKKEVQINKQEVYEPSSQKEKEIATSQKLPGTRKLSWEERFKSRVYIAKATDDSGIDPRIVTYFDSQAVISEQYRSLRTNIRLNSSPRPLKTIVISSAVHGEGKTITAVNLAITMARDLDRTVLLVDCDLRGGIIHRLLAINPTYGLSDILVGNAPLELAFYQSRINNLSILPRGNIPPNPSELLGSKKMRQILEELKLKFDYIILDAPPIIPLTDACVLSSLVDGVIFIVQVNKTARQLVKHAQDLLKHVHAKILGFVLTQVDPYNLKYRYRYYGSTQRNELDYTEKPKE